MKTDAVTVAETLVRDCLETLIQRQQLFLVGLGAPRNKAEAAAIIRLTEGLLEHLHADAKQMRVEQ